LHVKNLQKLIKPKKVSCVDNHGRSAVHIAAHKGAIKFLNLLAEKGADFSIPDKEGQTPLHLA
jgi:ankyrin repeat protein